MHVFENIYMCTYTCVYRQARRQRMIPEGGANGKTSRQHLRMSGERSVTPKSAVESRAVSGLA